MINLIATNVFLFVLALVLAILEIQIEGQHGWAKNLPTWRPRPHHPLARVYARFMSGKQLTGYHAAMFSFVFLVFHVPYVFGLPITLNNWLHTLSLFFMYMVVWDFLWFVLNPFYPLKHFKKGMIEWHSQWLWFAPRDYFAGAFISFAVLVPLIIMRSGSVAGGIISWWLGNVGLFILQTLVVVFISLTVLDIDNWNVRRGTR